MISIIHGKQLAFLSLVFVVSLSLLGCAGSMGGKVPLDRQITLAEGAGTKGSYKTGQVTVTYMFNRSGDNMSLSGTVSHRGGFDDLNVRILFSDAEGQVLKRHLVYSSGYRSRKQPEGGRNFKEDLKVPPGAVGFSFSYSSKQRSGNR